MSNKIKIALLSVAVVIISACTYYYFSLYISTDNARVKIGNIQMSAEVSGYVSNKYFEDNQNVKLGETIVQIDKKQYQIAYEKSLADYEHNIADAKFAKDELQKFNKMYKKRAVSESDLDRAHRDFDIANANVHAAKANLDSAKYNLDATKILAPVNGTVANFAIKPGDYVTPSRVLFNIIDHSDIWIEANFKETDVADIKLGKSASIEIDTFHGRKYKAHVVSIVPATGSEFSLIPPQNASGNWIKIVQRVGIRLEFDQGQDLSDLASGMSANVKIYT